MNRQPDTLYLTPIGPIQGFRMPAVKTVPYARLPASESRQRTNPRVMWAEGAAYSAMEIWVMRKVGATDRNALERE